MSLVNQRRVFIGSVIVHLFFYISAFSTHSLNFFFVHINIGQDFFQIPNGVYSLLHGGTLNGIIPAGIAPYIQCCDVNFNVYHPFFTLIVGLPLILFTPWIAFGVWVCIHLLVTVGLLFFLWSRFKKHRYVFLALSFFLLNSYHYYEIWHAQFHFLFNLFTILFLYESVTKGDTKKAGVYLLLSLLVKPIGLLWIVPLVLYKRFKTVAIGLGSFILLTGIFSLFPFGRYYLDNLLHVSRHTFIATHNIYATTYIWPSFPIEIIKVVSIMMAIGLVILQLVKKPPLFTIITLWICYELLFYPLVYAYQMTILGGIFCLGILLNIIPMKKHILIPMIFLTLPTWVFLFHLEGNWNLNPVHLSANWLYTVMWLFYLFIVIVWDVVRAKKDDLR